MTRCFDAQKSCAAAGYSDGTIKIFNYISNTTIATLRGHTSAISSLYSFGGKDHQGSFFLASGGCDCDIIVWDLVSLSVLVKLRGHKDAVTDITYFATSRRRFLVSSSKDALVKVWCLDSTVCVQTIVGHHCEVWSVSCVVPLGGSTTAVVTGGADGQLRGYRVNSDASEESILDDEAAILKYIGTVSTQCGTDKVVALKLSRRGDKLAAQSTGKVVDLFSVRSATEVSKKAKRRLKRTREKSARIEESTGDTVETEEDDLMLSDILEPLSVLRCPYPVRGFDFSPTASLSGQAERSPLAGIETSDTALVSSARNMLEIYKIPSSADASVSATTPTTTPQRSALLDLHGHRSDVRCVCLSADGRMVATCSSDGLKVSTYIYILLTIYF